MAVYVVGDIQGCYKPLQELLKKVSFDARNDVLWCAGDMVNRGSDSLGVLRFLKSLGDACVCVLGNHDIQLLAYYAGGKSFAGDTLDEVLQADDAEELIDWLRFQPLFHHDETLGWSMVHAGLSPLWDSGDATANAKAVEQVLQSEAYGDFCTMLQRKDFSASEPSDKNERLSFSVSVLTRTRFCSKEGVFDWKQKTADAKDERVKPWFEHADAKWKKDGIKKMRVVFGHWAAKGLVQKEEVLGLDTGCVWGGELSMAKLERGRVAEIFSVTCPRCADRH